MIPLLENRAQREDATVGNNNVFSIATRIIIVARHHSIIEIHVLT